MSVNRELSRARTHSLGVAGLGSDADGLTTVPTAECRVAVLSYFCADAECGTVLTLASLGSLSCLPACLPALVAQGDVWLTPSPLALGQCFYLSV